MSLRKAIQYVATPVLGISLLAGCQSMPEGHYENQQPQGDGFHRTGSVVTHRASELEQTIYQERTHQMLNNML